MRHLENGRKRVFFTLLFVNIGIVFYPLNQEKITRISCRGSLSLSFARRDKTSNGLKGSIEQI